MEMNRRTFLKTTAAAAVAVSLSGVLAGCSEGNGDLFAEAVGLGQTADLQGMQLTVNSLGTISDIANGTFYMVPSVKITNGGALPIAVTPEGGSFSIILPNKTELTINEKTMDLIRQSKTLTPLQEQTVARGKTVKGDICASGSGVSRVAYVYVVYYPVASDRTTYLRCKINSNEFDQLLGF